MQILLIFESGKKIEWDKCFKDKLITFLLGDKFRKDMKLQDNFFD
jgi:hypothetical protein